MLESFQGSSLPVSFTCLAQVWRARRLSGRLFGKALNAECPEGMLRARRDILALLRVSVPPW